MNIFKFFCDLQKQKNNIYFLLYLEIFILTKKVLIAYKTNAGIVCADTDINKGKTIKSLIIKFL